MPVATSESDRPLNDAFRRHWKRLQRTRSRYSGQLMELVETQRQLDELIKTPPPATAIIEPQDRAKAYQEHVVLTGDLNQLGNHLEDVRRAMGKVYARAEQPLAKVLTSLATIRECAKVPEASKLSPEKRLALEKISETAAELDTLASGFAQEWNQGFKNLAEQTIDPKKRDVLDFHDRIATKASDHEFRARQFLDKAKAATTRVWRSRFGQRPGTFPDSHPHARNQRPRRLASALFNRSKNAPRPERIPAGRRPSQRSRGLTQRTSLIMKEIEGELEAEARQRAFDERQQKIESLTRSAKILRDATDEIASTMIDTLSKMQKDGSDTGTYLDHVFKLETVGAKREFVQKQIDRVTVQLKQIEDDPIERQFPETVTVEAHVVSKRPKNLANLISTILAAWGTSFIGILGVSRMARRH